MSATTIQQMADRVSGLLEERLQIRGAGLTEKLARGGRRLPRHVRQAAQVLALAAQMSHNPKLLIQIDEGKVAEAYDRCLRYLGPLGARGRRWFTLQSMVAQIAFGLIVVIGGALLLARWRGLI